MHCVCGLIHSHCVYVASMLPINPYLEVCNVGSSLSQKSAGSSPMVAWRGRVEFEFLVSFVCAGQWPRRVPCYASVQEFLPRIQKLTRPTFFVPTTVVVR